MATRSDQVSEAIEWPVAPSQFADHTRWVHAVLRRRFGENVSPEDIVQEACLRAAEAADVRHPRALLLRIASRLAIDQLRRQQRAAAYIQAHQLDGEASAPDQEQAVLLKQLLGGLPTVYRETFLLSRFGGLSYEQIAARQKISVKTVEYRISRALAYCSARLDD